LQNYAGRFHIGNWKLKKAGKKKYKRGEGITYFSHQLRYIKIKLNMTDSNTFNGWACAGKGTL
jgi:hypothetical protein